MKTFVDSSSLLGDAAALRARMKTDGYLYLPGIIDRSQVLQCREEVLSTVRSHGWLAEGSDPADALPGALRVEGAEGWWDGYCAVLGLESLNKLAHAPAVLGVMNTLLGEDVVVHPRKIARIIWPDPRITTPPHQDITHLGGTVDVFTCWIPIGDVPAELGGLKVLPGSHHTGAHALAPSQGAGGQRVVGVDDDDPAWTSCDYSAGDVVVFHSCTIHAGLPNQTQQLRLSVDNRYQARTGAISKMALAPHFWRDYLAGKFANPPRDVPLPSWDGFTEGWSTKKWVDAPADLEVIDALPFDPPERAFPSAGISSAYVDTSSLYTSLQKATRGVLPERVKDIVG